MARIEMLDDDDGRRKVGGKASKHRSNRGNPPCGRGHGDDVELGSREPRGGFGCAEIAPLG